MKKKNGLIISCLLMLGLVFTGCVSEQLPTVTSQVVPTLTVPIVPTSILTALPTSVIPVEIKSIVVEPSVVKNGDTVFIQVTTSPGGSPIMLDISQLDSTQKKEFLLRRTGENIYSGKYTISYGNIAANGIKSLPLAFMNQTGESAVETIQIELKNHPPVLDQTPPSDNFDNSYYDPSKWIFDGSGGGTMDFRDGKLLVTTGNELNSGSKIRSVWKFAGDFDVQVDFQNGEGWVPTEPYHLLVFADLGVEINGRQYEIARRADIFQNVIISFRPSGQVESNVVSALTGKLRLIRVVDSLVYLYDIGDGWVELGIVNYLPAGPVQVYMGSESPNLTQVFSTYFDNFTINSGITIR